MKISDENINENYFQGGLICGFAIGVLIMVLALCLSSFLPIQKSCTVKEISTLKGQICDGK